MAFSDRYAQAFRPLAATPLVLTRLTVAVMAVRLNGLRVVGTAPNASGSGGAKNDRPVARDRDRVGDDAEELVE